ncbi:MAG: DUF2256 domain-containing protein [Acidimicrobiales bacterium]
MTVETPSRNDGVTMRPCPVCQGSFEPRGRARYCSDRCRQEASRRRHQAEVPEVPLPPKGKRRAVTVYQCDSCGERALGEQYCEECRTFMRSLGRGDMCPHCDGPVAVSDLLGDDQPLPPAGGRR